MITNVNTYIISADITVKDFLAQFDLSNSSFTSTDFLKFNILKGLVRLSNGSSLTQTNLDRIKLAYITSEELNANVTNKTPDEVVIRAGTEVGLPNFAIKRDLTRTSEPDIIQLAQSPAFISSVLRDLLQDPDYSQSITAQSKYLGRKDTNDISVYIWIRSVIRENGRPGTWYNVSSFVEDLKTSVSANGGSFSFSLAAIKGVYDALVGWGFDDVRGYNDGSVRNETISKIAISKYRNEQGNTMLPTPAENLIRETSFFNTVLQENDLVYIRFERLDLEREQQDKVFSGQDIPGNIYDMIGLIDVVSDTTTPMSIQTTVQGRDLMKMLIEDGSYFFPEQIAQNLFTNPESKLAKRNILEAVGSTLLSYSYSFKSIELILKFIFNKFSNIGYIPNDALSGYGSRFITNKYELKVSQLKNKFTEVIEEIDQVFLTQQRQGLWGITDLIFDPTAATRVLADNTIAQDNGSIINTIRKICQTPFVEFFGDTYGDRYILTVRKPPTDQLSYQSLVYGDPTYDKVKDGVNYKGKDIQSKIKQDRERARLTTTRTSLISDVVIDIDEVDVISDNFSYHNEAYSWYRLIPRGLGQISDLAAFQLAPLVALDEYAEVWGNKMYTMECNYSPSQYLDDSDNNTKASYIEAQAFYDLRFLIQSNAYLPFTRFGSIVLTGNRLIKRGYFIYYKPTNEIFYVDSVSQLRGVNSRQTILQVSRGMREPFIKGLKIDGIKENVSYFNIVNTKFEGAPSINKTEFLKNWKVNTDVFNFFLARRQWNETYNNS